MQESPSHLPYSKVVIIAGENDDGTQTVYEAGNDTGETLEVNNPLIVAFDETAGNQIAADILARVQGYAYKPFSAGDALLDPAAELGDAVTIGGVYSVIASLNTQFDALYTAEISAPDMEEIDHEYPYESSANREIRREAATITAQLRVDVDSITAEVAGIYALEWASGTSYRKGNAVKITAADGTATYYECIVAHTANAANKPPNATFWSVISAPSVASMVKVGLDGITLSASAGSNQSTVTISAGGIVVDSAIVRFSSIVADSVEASWVYAGNISAAQITAGTLAAASITGLKGKLSLLNESNTVSGYFGAYAMGGNTYVAMQKSDTFYVGLTDYGGHDDIVCMADNMGIYADLYIYRGGLFLSSGYGYGTLAQRNALTPTAGRIFFVRA